MKNPLAIEEYVDLLLDLHTTPRDRALLEFVLLPSPTQAELDACLDICDIEVLGAAKALLLSYVMEAHPELKFSDYAGPRLKGLINFFRFHNLKLLTHFSKIGKALNRAGIPMLIFKGGAMKFLRPAVMRPMADVDILIPRERMQEAMQICHDLGYIVPLNIADHAVDVTSPDGNGAVDLHHQILIGHSGRDAFAQAILRRVEPRTAFGVKILLPCPEDLLFIGLSNLVKDLSKSIKSYSMPLNVLDCHFLGHFKTGFDWNILRDNAEITQTMHHLKLGVYLLNRLSPGIAPEIALPFTRDMQVYCERAYHSLSYFTASKKTKALSDQTSPFRKLWQSSNQSDCCCGDSENRANAL